MGGEKKEEMPAEMQQFLDELKQMTEGASPTERMRMGQVVAEMMISLAAEQAPTAKEIAKAPPHLRGMLESLQRKGEATAAAGLDRMATEERNGREVVTDALDEATLRGGAVEVLVERYVDIAVAMHFAKEYGRITRYNRLYKRLDAIDEALKARMPDARSALLPLLSDRNPGVRYFAARDCLPIAPEQAVAALETLTYDSAGSLGASAQSTLDSYRSGRWAPT